MHFHKLDQRVNLLYTQNYVEIIVLLTSFVDEAERWLAYFVVVHLEEEEKKEDTFGLDVLFADYC